jgi:hypothetical protein
LWIANLAILLAFECNDGAPDAVMITTTRLDDGAIRITSDQGGAFVHNLSGDYVLPSSLISVSEPDGDNRLWYAMDVDTGEVRQSINRNLLGSVNDELMWRRDATFWYTEGNSLRSADGTRSTQLITDLAVQWRSGSASCDRIQFVKGVTDSETFIQPFDSETGKLTSGFWLRVASEGAAMKARNVVRFDHWMHGPGFLFSTQSDPAHEHFCTLTGKDWHRFETDDSNGAARWSHAATWGETFVACRPNVGTIEQYGRDGIKELVSQERLKELTGRTQFSTWAHGSTNGATVVFSVDANGEFNGVYGLDLTTLETWLIRKAENPEIVNQDFASMARTAITLDGRHAVWHERPGVVYVAPVRARLAPDPEPPVDELAELTKRVDRLERLIEGVHAATNREAN